MTLPDAENAAVTNPMTDVVAFLTADTGDYASLAAARYVVLIVFYVLAIMSLTLLVINLRDDRTQRSGRLLWLWLVRVLVGVLGFVLMLKTLPLGTDNGLHGLADQVAGRAALPEIGRFASDAVMPNYGLFDVLMFLAAIVFASSFILGLFVRVAGFGGLVAGLALWLGVYGEVAGSVPIWSWSPMLIALLCGTCMVFAAGRALGADAWIRRNIPSVRDRRGFGLVLRLLT